MFGLNLILTHTQAVYHTGIYYINISIHTQIESVNPETPANVTPKTTQKSCASITTACVAHLAVMFVYKQHETPHSVEAQSLCASKWTATPHPPAEFASPLH